MAAENARVSLRSKLSFGIGCVGRDATYTLVSNFILTYLTLGVGISNWQLGVVGVIMVIARVWDAVNDPIMGTIIDNTRTRWGRYKPYILTGALLNCFFTVLLFTDTGGSRWFPVIFGVTYVLWGMTYTMNDISYWSLLPSLTVDLKERERVISIARIGANVGLFLTTAAVPALTGGRMATMFPLIARAVAVLFVACQILIVWGVQEPKNAITAGDSGHTRLRDMLGVIFKNDQLLVIAGAILLFNIGYFTTTAFGVQFFYFDYGVYGGMEFTYFAISIGVAQILTLSLYPQLSKRWNRRQLFAGGTIAVTIGYAGLMAVGYVLPMNMVILCAIGLILFAGQAVIQLLNYVLLADTIEYGQWKLGTRNSGITYSLNPFITKLAGAIQAGVFSLTMIVSGLNPYSEAISRLDQDTSLSREEVLRQGQAIVDSVPAGATLIMRLSMIVLPLALILCCYVIYRKKFKIDEAFYTTIIRDLEARAEKGEQGNG